MAKVWEAGGWVGTGDADLVSQTELDDAVTSLASSIATVDADKVDRAGDTMTGDLIVPDDAYDATGWNANLEVPTKNAIRDKIETMGAGGALRVEDEGSTIVAAATGMNFAGAGVTVTDAGSNEALVTIPGGGTTYGSDQAPSATITASTTQSGHPVSNLTDGNDATDWSDGTTTKPATLTADFGVGVTKSLRRVQLYDVIGSGYGIAATWVVQYSDDNSAWYGAGSFSWPFVATTATTWRPPQTQTVDFLNVGAHRYWRVIITHVVTSTSSGASGIDFLHIQRLSMYEAA